MNSALKLIAHEFHSSPCSWRARHRTALDVQREGWVGTAYSASAPLWFTLSHGIVNELYFPHVDTPNTRDLQFLITDGETFCHEEKRDLDHTVEYPEKNALLYRLTNTERSGRYRIVKEIIVQPHSAVLLINTRVEINDPTLRENCASMRCSRRTSTEAVEIIRRPGMISADEN